MLISQTYKLWNPRHKLNQKAQIQKNLILNDEIKKKINLKNLSKEKNNNKKIRVKSNRKKK